MMRLNPVALAIAFGVAGVVVVILFGAVMGAMWGMIGSGSMMGTGGMHGTVGGGPGYGSMMGSGPGFFVYAVICGFLGGAIAGLVSAWVYNSALARNP
jgi:hypothetical protein